jgi:STE24 endopeptidase
MVFLYPTVIQPLFNKLTPLAEGELRTKIEALAGHLKFPLKHLYEIDGSKRSSHSNAYFFGLPWSKHIVVYDTLIQNAKVDGVEAVLAHELGHWYYYHPTKLMVIAQIHFFAIIGCFPAFLHSTPLLLSFDFPARVAVHPPVLIAFVLYQSILTPVDTFVTAAMHAISRNFEFQADQFACELDAKLGVPGSKGMGKRLGEALIAIMVDNLATLWIDPWYVQSSTFRSVLLTSTRYSAWHHTHPTLTERLKALDKFESGTVTTKEKKEL